MSPEQSSGGTVDHRTDIWSFGVLLYEMITGRLPFEGDYEQAVLYSILNEDPEPISGDVPEPLRSTVSGALQKDPENRFH